MADSEGEAMSKRTRCRLGHANPTRGKLRRSERRPRRERALKASAKYAQKMFFKDIASISCATGLTFTEHGVRQVRFTVKPGGASR